MVAEIALGGLEKEDKELHQLDRAVFSKVPFFLFFKQSAVGMLASLTPSCSTLLLIGIGKVNATCMVQSIVVCCVKSLPSFLLPR